MYVNDYTVENSTNSMAIPACVCLPNSHLKRFANVYLEVCLPSCFIMTQLHCASLAKSYACLFT